MPSGCGARPVQVALKDGNTWRTGNAVVTDAGIVKLDHYYTAGASLTVLATVDGWDLPVTWSFAATTCVVPTGTATCAADVKVFVGNKPRRRALPRTTT